MSSLRRFCSRRRASTTSFTFRVKRFSEESRNVFTTCCVIVDPPQYVWPRTTFLSAQRAMAR